METMLRATRIELVRQLWASYAHLIDDGAPTVAAWADLFTRDAVLILRGTTFEGRDAIATWAGDTVAGRTGRHLVVNIEMELAEDAGSAAVVADFAHVGGASGGLIVDVLGRYRSHLRWHDDGWRISRHLVELL